MVLPSGMSSRIESIDTADGEVPEAFAPMSVTVRLTDDVDVSRGDMIARPHNAPAPMQDIDAMVCWMADKPLGSRDRLMIKHTTRTVKAAFKDLQYRLDVNTLHRDDTASTLGRNDIGRVQFRTAQPIFADSYSRNRLTGGFIVIDEATNATVGAGMII